MPDNVFPEGKLNFPLAFSVVLWMFVMCAFIFGLLCKHLPVQADVKDGFARTTAKSQLSFQGPWPWDKWPCAANATPLNLIIVHHYYLSSANKPVWSNKPVRLSAYQPERAVYYKKYVQSLVVWKRVLEGSDFSNVEDQKNKQTKKINK